MSVPSENEEDVPMPSAANGLEQSPSDDAICEPSVQDIGCENRFNKTPDLEDCKWQVQPFVRQGNANDRVNNCKALTRLDSVSDKTFCDASPARSLEFIGDRLLSEELSDISYYEANIGTAERGNYTGIKENDVQGKFPHGSSQYDMRHSPYTESINAAAVDSARRVLDSDFPLDELVWGEEKDGDEKLWRDSMELICNDKSAICSHASNVACDQQCLLQSLIDGAEEGSVSEYGDPLFPNSTKGKNQRAQSFTELLESDATLMNSRYHNELIRYPNATKTRGLSLSNDSGIEGSIAEFVGSPMNHSGREESSVSPESIKGQVCVIGGFASGSSDSGQCKIEEIQDGEHMQLGGSKTSSKKTAYNEKWGVKVLKAWCSEMSTTEDFEGMSPNELNELLSRFWAEGRKANGDYYGKNSLYNLRAMINKHLKGKPYCVEFDIVTDDRFRSSNETLEKQIKILNDIGRTISHKGPISMVDLRKMYDVGILANTNPLALLRKVWFEITLHFCHKRSEPQEKLTRHSFRVYRDQSFRTYVAKATDANVREHEEIRMYETGGDLCPVRSFQQYIDKLHPQQMRLFQRPIRKFTQSSAMWYGKPPMGEKALQQMMADISVAANLSKRYTNHCVRTTALEQFSATKRKANGKNRPTEHLPNGAQIYPFPTGETYHVRCNTRTPSNSNGHLNYASATTQSTQLSQNTSPYYVPPRQQYAYNYQEYQITPHSTGRSYGEAYKNPYKRCAPTAYQMPCHSQDGVNHIHMFNAQSLKKMKLHDDFRGNGALSARRYNASARDDDVPGKNLDFSETIICAGGGGGIPEIQSITNENYATIQKIVSLH